MKLSKLLHANLTNFEKKDRMKKYDQSLPQIRLCCAQAKNTTVNTKYSKPFVLVTLNKLGLMIATGAAQSPKEGKVQPSAHCS